MTSCPHCNTRHRRHVDLETRTVHANGDYTLCLTCGQWCVFDDQCYGGMRKPLIREQRWLEANPRAQAMTSGWRRWKMGKT